MKKQFKLFITLSFLMIGAFAFASTTEAASNSTSSDISAFEFLMKGGVFLIPIGILLFYSLIVIVEKYRYIRKMTRYNASLLADIKSDLSSNNFEQALNTLAKDKSAFGSVLNEGVLSMDRPYLERQSNMEKAANIEVGKMEKNLGHLG